MAVPQTKTSLPSKPVPIQNFAPDGPQTQEGGFQDGFNIFPITRGVRTFPGQRVLGRGLPSPCFGSFSGLLVATPIFAAATASGLYLADSNGNLQPSQVGYANTTGRWRFAAYGTPTDMPSVQDLFATNGTDPIQRYQLSTGTWTNIPNGAVDNSPPPLASIVVASDYGIIFVEPMSQTFISSFNKLPPTWLGSVPLQVYVQSITQSPGNITAAHRLRNTMVFYKPNAIHVAYFAGGTVGWDVQDSSIQYGVTNQEWVINTGDMHYFPTLTNDFWSFDGWNLNRLPNAMAEFFRQDYSPAFINTMYGLYDQTRELLIWVYSSNAASPAGTLDSWLIYYLRSQTWSFQRLPIELPLSYLSPTDGHTRIGYFGLDHAPRIYDDTLAPGRSYVTTNYWGDYKNMWQSSRLRLGFSLLPQSVSVTPISMYVAGKLTGPQGDAAALPGAISEPMTADGWVNLVYTDRLTSYEIVMQGLGELVEAEPLLVFGGEQ